jgi:hypothetical protein
MELRQLFLNKSSLSTEEVPTLISKEQQEILFQADKAAGVEPYFITQEINFAEEANNIEYRKEFFDSFLGKLKDTAIPGSRDGHQTWHESGSKRASNDLFLIGGKIDAKKKLAYFKNYIPISGESGDNTEFIKNARLGLINFSLVTYAKLNIEVDSSTGEEYWYITESIRGERNDAVGRLEGAMAQEIIQNRQENKMPENQKPLPLIEQVKNALAAGTLNIADIVPADRLINAEIEAGYNVSKYLCSEYGIKTEEIKEIFKNLNDRVLELSRNALLSEAFGPEKFENGDLNKCRAAATELIGDGIKTEGALKNKIEQLKKNALILELNKEGLDPNKTEIIQNGKGEGQNNTGSNEPEVIEI